MVIIDFKEFLITTYLAEWMKKKPCACNLPTYNWIWTLFGCSFILKIVHTHTSNHKIIDFGFFFDKRILNIHFFKVLREEQWIKLQCKHTSQFTDFVLNEKFCYIKVYWKTQSFFFNFSFRATLFSMLA